MTMTQTNGAGTLRIALSLGLVGMALTALSPDRFWANFILWFIALLSVALGALFIVAMEHLVGARWSIPLRRAPERLATLIVPLAPIALLALFSLPVLYPWAHPETRLLPLVAAKSAWLNRPFFIARVLVCLAVWILSCRVFVGGSLEQDGSRDPAVTVRLRRLAPVFMIVFALTVTVVAFDWISSLEPEWYSDIFGVYLFAGVFLAGLAGTTLVVLHMIDEGKLPRVRPDHLYNLGCFMFAFTVFWSYIAFAQYLLMWYANLPEEVVWYKHRIHGSWQTLTLALALVHFVIPFFALIPRGSKSDIPRLRFISILLLSSHLFDLYWLIFPVFAFAPLFSWPEISFGLFFLAYAQLFVNRAMTKGEDMPVGDPFLQEGLAFHL